MLKRFATALLGSLFGYALLGSVVFTGVSLSKQLIGRWLVVQVFNVDVSNGFPPMSLELDKYGRLKGRSRCGTFTGQWSTGHNELRFKSMVPSGCDCGELRVMEQRLISAMGTAENHKLEGNGLVLLRGGKAVAKLIPART